MTEDPTLTQRGRLNSGRWTDPGPWTVESAAPGPGWWAVSPGGLHLHRYRTRSEAIKGAAELTAQDSALDGLAAARGLESGDRAHVAEKKVGTIARNG